MVPKSWVVCTRTTQQGWKDRWVLGLWSRPQRGQGRGKKAEAQTFPGLTSLSGGEPPDMCLIACVWVWCWPCVSRAALRPHTPSVQLTRTTTEQQRQQWQQSGREASWLKLKEVRKVKRVEKVKRGDKTQGGRSKTNFGEKQNFGTK